MGHEVNASYAGNDVNASHAAMESTHPVQTARSFRRMICTMLIWHAPASFENEFQYPRMVSVSMDNKRIPMPVPKMRKNTYNIFYNFTVISDVYRFVIANKNAFTNCCLTQWILNLLNKSVPSKFHGSGGQLLITPSQFSQVLGTAKCPIF